MKLIVLGDSIAWGAWDKEGGWVSRLQRDTNSKTVDTKFEEYQAIYNLSISGDTSNLIIERFENEIKPRLNEEGECLEFMFAVGINDSLYSNENKKFRTDLVNFEENIEKLVKLGKKYTNKIVFVGLTPVNESLVDPVPWIPGESYKNQYIRLFDDSLKKVCLKMKVIYIPLFKKIYKAEYKTLLEDGVHPNTGGHEMISELIKEALEKERLI